MKGLQAIAMATRRKDTYTTIALDALDCLANRLLIGHIHSFVYSHMSSKHQLIMEIFKNERSAKQKMINING